MCTQSIQSPRALLPFNGFGRSSSSLAACYERGASAPGDFTGCSELWATPRLSKPNLLQMFAVLPENRTYGFFQRDWGTLWEAQLEPS